MSPDKVRHEDVTFQVPVKSPAHVDPFGQLAGWVVPPEAPPLAEEPPLPAPPLEVPPLPDPPPPEPLQPLIAIVEARATALTSPMSPFRMIPHERVLCVRMHIHHLFITEPVGSSATTAWATRLAVRFAGRLVSGGCGRFPSLLLQVCAKLRQNPAVKGGGGSRGQPEVGSALARSGDARGGLGHASWILARDDAVSASVLGGVERHVGAGDQHLG